MVGPRPKRQDYVVPGIGGKKIFRQGAFNDAVADWQRRKNEERAASRPRRETAFRERERPDGKTDVYFNAPGDGARHGHHVRNLDGTTEYVRDPDGNVYVDRSKEG